MLNYKKYAKSTAHQVDKSKAIANVTYAIKTSTALTDEQKQQLIKQLTK